MKAKILFREKIEKNEDTNYDNYFKVVYTCFVSINNQVIDFRYTEEDGVGITIEIKDNGAFTKVNRSDKFEYLLLEELFSQSPINFDSITAGEEIELSFDYYEEDEIIEF